MNQIPIKSPRFAVLFALCTVLCLSSLYAIPGVKDFLPTESGQYVYYRDSTFTKPAYIGFLQYDEGSYAIRYYAPEAESGSKEIMLFFTLDTAKDKVLMTGEKFEQVLQPEDAPTVNYLHDLFYEFAANRKRIDPEKLAAKKIAGKPVKSVIPQKEEQDGDMHILGGKIRIFYDYLIPLFNIREIQTGNGKPLFTAVTMGQLLNSADNSFADFKGIPRDKKEQDFNPTAADLISAGITGKIDKKSPALGKKTDVLFPSKAETEQMDAEYKAVADNLGFWGSEALLYTDFMETPSDFFKDKLYGLSHVLLRSLSFGSGGSYACIETQSIAENAGFSVLANQSYDNKTERFYINIRIISETQSGTASVTGFSADIDYFNKHKAYFIQKIREISEAELKRNPL